MIGSNVPWAIETGSPARDARSSSKPSTVGTKPLNARIAAGRGRSAAKPSAYDITAPWENPASTSLSGGIPTSAVTPSTQAESAANVGPNVAGSGKPTSCTTYQCAPPGGSESGPRGRKPASRRSGSSSFSERLEVVLVGAAAVQEHERALRLAGRRASAIG